MLSEVQSSGLCRWSQRSKEVVAIGFVATENTRCVGCESGAQLGGEEGQRYRSNVPVQVKPLTNWSEAIVSEQLHGGLEGSPWHVAPHLAVRDVIELVDERLTPEELGIRERGHFDFAVYPSRRFDDPPSFVVEFDGPYHDDPEVAARDIAKNRLCKRARLPLLRLTQQDLTPLEQRTVVNWIAARFAAHRREMPALDRRCRAELERLAPDDLEMAIDSCDYDPGVLFDIDHPFPENRIIAERLWRRFGMRTMLFRDSSAPARCGLEVSGWSTRTEDGRVSEFTICERRCSIRGGARELHTFTAAARMAGAHKVRRAGRAGGTEGLHAPMGSAAHLRWLRQRVEDLSCDWVPGAAPDEITQEISTYNAMHEAERWAAAYLDELPR